MKQLQKAAGTDPNLGTTTDSATTRSALWQAVSTDRRARLSLLWTFAILNYLYCDVVGLMDPGVLKQYLAGDVGGIHISQGFLLGAALLMEIPIAMVLLSGILPRRVSRWANVVAGAVMTLVQLGSLFMGSGLTGYYTFFSVVEITCTAFIAGYAWRWHPSTG
jgi:MFS family permease